MGDLQGKQCLETAACLKRVGFEFIGVHVLVGKGQFGPVQDDQPAQLEPDEEKRKSGKTPVDGVVIRGPDLKGDVRPLYDLEDRAGDDSGQQRGGKADLRIRHENVEKGEKAPQKAVGKQFQQKKEQWG